MTQSSFNLLSFTGKMKTLHMTWFAFFLTFVVWFNIAPFRDEISQAFGLTGAQFKSLLILNVSMAIPARIIIGMLTDRFGPRKVYSALLLIASFPCFFFAFAQDYQQLAIARFALGFVGAGFVIGIRMVSEWFPHNELGTAEGIYGGWGNFGSAAAALTLPTVALLFGGENGWRYAIAITGALMFIYSFIYFMNVRDVPEGSHYFKPKSSKSMLVTSQSDLWFLLIMKIPLYIALSLLANNLTKVGLLTPSIKMGILVGLFCLYLFDAWNTFSANMPEIKKGIPEVQQYKFKQVAVLNILYFATFGSELAVVSMLPSFFKDTFGLTTAAAAMVASSYAFMNLMSRPGGGLISDRFGRKKTLLILTAGLALGYLGMSLVGSSWPLWAAIAVAMCCSFFVQAGEGAVFAVVPLIKRSQTGAIAGMTGAYGNVGAVIYLIAYVTLSVNQFFLLIAGTAVLGFVSLLFLEEPQGEIAEVAEDGTVQMIAVG